jgi:hypothetical protein
LDSFGSQNPGKEPVSADDTDGTQIEQSARPKGIGVYDRPEPPLLARPWVMALILLVLLALAAFVFTQLF